MCYDETMENNPIIKCEICEIGVHVLCYSIQDTNNFKCSPCAKDVSPSTVYCAICNKSGGAMKSTTKGKWVKVISNSIDAYNHEKIPLWIVPKNVFLFAKRIVSHALFSSLDVTQERELHERNARIRSNSLAWRHIKDDTRTK